MGGRWRDPELLTLPEITTNRFVDGDDVWMSIPRLAEISPPEPAAEIAPWLDLHKSPDRAPACRSEISVGGWESDPQTRLLDDHPEIRAHFEWYRDVLWEPWAVAERGRRRVMALYSKLFKLHRQLSGETGEQPLEFVWGIGVAVWQHPETKATVRYPVLLQLCDLTLNTRTFNLEIRPKDTPPKLSLSCFDGLADGLAIADLEREWRQGLGTDAWQLNPFEAETFGDTLTKMASKLDSQGRCLPGLPGEAIPAPSPNLVITHRWVTFVRKRSSDLFIEDIHKLKEQIDKGADIPGVVAKFVNEGEDRPIHAPSLTFRGLSSSEGWESAEDLYFPLP